jgi:hypothetical protein
MKTKKKAAKKAAKKVAPKATAEPTAEPTAVVLEAVVKASPQEAMVISLANNPRYVYASLDGEKVAVSVPVWMAPNLVRKQITIIKTPDSEHYEIFKDGN